MLLYSQSPRVFGGFTHLMYLELLLIMDKVNFNGEHPPYRNGMGGGT